MFYNQIIKSITGTDWKVNQMMKQIKKSFRALGTVNTVTVAYEEAMEVRMIEILEEIKAKVLQLDDQLSVFKDTSEISQINAAAGKALIPVSRDTELIIRKAVEYSEISGGAFDITTCPLSKLWGIGKKGDYIPSDKEIREAKEFVNYKDIVLEENPARIGLRKASQAIDLGSIAKGYAADEARRILLENGITDAVINFGGSVIVLGNERSIGIQAPDKSAGTPMGAIRLKDKAAVTSGSYEHYFMKDGKRYHHLLDPRTGRPADQGIASITLIGASAIELDALTTAVFVLGMEEGIHLLERYDLDGVFVNNKQEIFVTKRLQDSFTLIKDKEIN
jgi:thiamine biosynthesis lipoprotein